MSATADMVVIGAGVIGLCIARSWKERYPDQRVVVLEKEARAGLHASGRNSGVLHAGLYYPPGSLKARFARDGNRALSAWCEERGVEVRRCGKLVVARDETEHAGLDELLLRARGNAVPLESVTEAEVAEIEPQARTTGRALFAPETCAVDPGAVMEALTDDVRSRGIEVRTGVAVIGRDAAGPLTTDGPVAAGYVVNAAGLYADRIARLWKFGQRYRILPFRGLYLYGDADLTPLACHIYPVPDLAMPFLGVHFTVTVSGRNKIGPTALPALWREQYGGGAGFSAGELAEVGVQNLLQWISDPSFRALAWREAAKMRRGPLLRDAAGLVQRIDPARWTHWGRPGIRAQLVDTEARKLVLDFAIEGDHRSFHVLNAISPAFTCSMPFAEWSCDRIEALRE